MASATVRATAHAHTTDVRLIAIPLLLSSILRRAGASAPAAGPTLRLEACALRIERSPLELNLCAELHETPVEYLRRLSPSRVVSAEDRDRRVRVEHVVGIHVSLESPRAETEDLGGAQIELVDPRTVQRVRLREWNGDGGAS